METELITIRDYCINYAIDPSFIHELEESGLLTLTIIDGDKFIHFEQLMEMDRFIHFHYDLEINVAGIEAIVNLLQKVRHMQHEIEILRTHIHVHEGH
ncbi:uncharacterized protein YlzI (FlbEa/FlbD family) [Pedobacter cryoconitis]|uniref:Uncharacterized protein YlzI (FlbEa/FlbD family) n=1 Tax=Pedobacter cryoconitis TaxID=188932 RepID=A0A7W8ZJF3_9SPHI|nr:chaperone modulator CbpM [Pedobacter cryoconitis]MBB5634935.1 uncharacterized protein YlzI (FlbEa/FlbD family) [Pedobacter cryoconitis]